MSIRFPETLDIKKMLKVGAVSFSPNTSQVQEHQGQSKILDLLPLLDVGQYGRLQMASNSLPSSLLRGDVASKLVL